MGRIALNGVQEGDDTDDTAIGSIVEVKLHGRKLVFRGPDLTGRQSKGIHIENVSLVKSRSSLRK
jgi:hypothetical protein